MKQTRILVPHPPTLIWAVGGIAVGNLLSWAAQPRDSTWKVMLGYIMIASICVLDRIAFVFWQRREKEIVVAQVDRIENKSENH